MFQLFTNGKRALALLLCLCLVLTLLPGTVLAAEPQLADGSYEGTGAGRNGAIVLNVTLQNGAINAIDVVSQQETPRYWEAASALIDLIVAANSPEVDGISGATMSSNGIKDAVRDALSKADSSISGDGTAESPFVIKTAVQLRSFAEKVDAGEAAYTAACVELGADIDLTGIDFNPIGQEGKATSNTGKLFAGQFDGKGHSISNLTIHGESDAEANIGLFSTLADTARVRNVKLENVSIVGTETGSFANIRAGGIAGDTARTSGSRAAIVDGCTVTGSVTLHAADGQAFAGGILGRAFTKAAVINCVSDVELRSTTQGSWNAAYAGGVVGMNGNNAVLANNAAFGSVSAENLSGSNDAYAGGIAGMLGGKLYNSYALGSAAIAQKNGVVKQYVGALAGQDSYAAGTGNYYSSAAVLRVTDEEGTETVLEARPWYMEDAGGLVSAEAMDAADMGTEAFTDILNGNIAGIRETLNEEELALRAWTLANGRVIPSAAVWGEEPPAPSIFASGSGSEADPWIILTKEQLQAFGVSVSEGEGYSGKYVQLGADLDLSGDNWEPIGSGSRFDGSFDGADHSISGLTEGSADAPLELDAAHAQIGLFGWLGEHAVIERLKLVDVSIHTHSAGSVYVGAIAGRMSGSDTEGDYHGAWIDNCVVTGVIDHTTERGTSFLGGVCGHVFKGAIINTWTNVTMRGVEKSGQLVEIGGIAGILNRALVANCYTLGAVTGSGYREVEQDIEGMACVGGVAGVNGGYIVNCYSEGDVTALEYSIDTGVLAGWVTGIAKVYNSWYNESAHMEIDGRTVDPVDPFGEVVSGGVSDEYGFTFPGGLVDKIEGYRPGSADASRIAEAMNASFAAFPIDVETIYGLQADSLRNWTAAEDHAVLGEDFGSVHYEQPQIEKDLEEEPEPSLQDGTWYGRSEDKGTVVAITVQDGEIIETAVISGDESGENYDYALARAKFKATFGDFTDYSQMDLSGFRGSGTAEDPYLIETGAQLRTLAEQIDEDVDFYDLYFKQAKDLDLSDQDWFPIGWGIFADADSDGFGQDLVALYPFRGHYDGDNHVITGLHAGTKEAPASGSWMGLFGIIQGDYTTNEIPAEGKRATVENVRIENVSFCTENRWRSYVGGLLGNAQGGFTIDNCTVTGSVSARSAEDFAMAGGLSGSLMYGLVTNCWTDMDVSAWSGKNYSYAAGMSALTNRATILNAYTLGDVHADADQTNRAEAGGFIALDGGVCVNCYAMGNVEIVSKYSMYLGGFVGMAASASETRQCYYNTDADQTVAGKPAEEKHFAGKYVNAAVDEPEQAKTAEEIGSEAFCELLNDNRLGIAGTLEEIGNELGADENGSSKYQSIYYRGDGSDLTEWVVLEDHAGFALPEQTPVNPFVDVQEGQYFYDAVLWAVNAKPQITTGTGKTTFSPNAACTRGQIVTFLWRAAGTPEPTLKVCPFKDVDEGAYYYKAVLWAVETGITTGTGKTAFRPNKTCTRAEAVTFLYRYAGSPGVQTGSCAFTDVTEGAYYYKAVLWAVETGITAGTTPSTFTPTKNCTRAEAVTFLYRLAKK